MATMTRNDQAGRFADEAADWLVRLKPGIATKEDLADFERWCRNNPANARSFAEIHDIWKSIGVAGENLFDPNALRDLAAGRQHQRPLARRAFLTGAVAASAIAASYAVIHPPLHLWPSLSEFNADYRTATGEQRHIALANDIALDMNTRTSIRVRPAVNDIAQLELIGGESMVAAKSHALDVTAAEGTVRATNANYNIRRDGDRVSVSCLAGEVQVICRSSQVGLTAERQVTYSSAGLDPVTVTDVAALTSWSQGFLVFQKRPLADVIAEINRYRSGRIVVMNRALGQRLVSGQFYLARLDEVVDKFHGAFGARVTRLPGGVVVLS